MHRKSHVLEEVPSDQPDEPPRHPSGGHCSSRSGEVELFVQRRDAQSGVLTVNGAHLPGHQGDSEGQAREESLVGVASPGSEGLAHGGRAESELFGDVLSDTRMARSGVDEGDSGDWNRDRTIGLCQLLLQCRRDRPLSLYQRAEPFDDGRILERTNGRARQT